MDAFELYSLYERLYAILCEIESISNDSIKDTVNHSTTGKVGDESGCPMSFSEIRKPHYSILTLAHGMKDVLEMRMNELDIGE